jgi:hypothetical protein
MIAMVYTAVVVSLLGGSSRQQLVGGNSTHRSVRHPIPGMQTQYRARQDSLEDSLKPHPNCLSSSAVSRG